MLKAVFFDLFKTLGDFKSKISDKAICDFLVQRGYEIYPQTFHYAFNFVTFIDHPRIGFMNYPNMFRKTFERIGADVDEGTIRQASKFYENNPFELYDESTSAVRRISRLGLKTAIVTTPPRFWFESGIKPILDDIDFICTAFEAGCEKSNPRIYKKALKVLKIKPSEVVVIGDNLELDVHNPKQMGMTAILISDEEGQVGADATASDVKEAVVIVENWIRSGAPAGI